MRGGRPRAAGSILLVSSVSAVEAAPMDDYGYTFGQGRA